MYEEFKVEITYLKTRNRVLQMSTPQGVVMIRIALVTLQDANGMFSLYWRWLNHAGEVQVQSSVFENRRW